MLIKKSNASIHTYLTPDSISGRSVYVVQHQTYPETISVFSSLDKAKNHARKLLFRHFNDEIKGMKEDRDSYSHLQYETYIAEYKADKLKAKKDIMKVLLKFNASYRDTPIFVFKRKVF